MSQQRLVVLCVGNTHTEQWLTSTVEPYGGYVYRADELLQALGMYVTYTPDIVVLDAMAEPDLAQKVYSHLRTIEAEPILILDDTSARSFEVEWQQSLNRQMSFDMPVPMP